ncbi:hypothetical protein [Synechococcus sp. PCC 7336]|uniref:hypothetical protein n=1 Tax=Synechococcus sp. PCC 7336 TaxID=195250 RepID=UPI00034C40F0|nr:hypothetical protein [Synechococcus sp. PCC 7336]
MPKLKQLDKLLDSLRALKHQPVNEESIALLQQALQSKLGVVVCRAARVSADLKVESLVPEMVEAFERLTHNPVDSDPGCLGKVGIVDALRQLQQREYDLFLQGICYQQWEPIWGGREDRAGHLRGQCALALAEAGYSDTLLAIGDLLADPEVETRVGTARAIAQYGSVCGIPLLRLRALSGETSPQVLEALFAALIALCQPQSEAIAFIARFLESDLADVPAVAALALGESRHAAAFVALQEWSERTVDLQQQRAAMVAIATMRLPAAFDYLFGAIERGSDAESAIALESLAIYRTDIEIWERAEMALAKRNA